MNKKKSYPREKNKKRVRLILYIIIIYLLCIQTGETIGGLHLHNNNIITLSDFAQQSIIKTREIVIIIISGCI